jgi:ADP-ribosylglycohydrolase
MEECIRRAISFGGDTDTIASIAGAISAAYYGLPPNLWDQAQKLVDKNLLDVLN